MTNNSVMIENSAGGALPVTAATVARLADQAGLVADRASGLSDRLRDDLRALLLALGGGPPAQLREAEAQMGSGAAALGEAVAALQEAVGALRAFAARST